MMACSSSSDFSPSWKLAKSNSKGWPSVATLEAFRQLKIIRSGVAKPTLNHNLEDQGITFRLSHPLWPVLTPAAATLPPLYFSGQYFLGGGARSVQCLICLTASFVKLLSPWIWLCLSRKYWEFCFHLGFSGVFWNWAPYVMVEIYWNSKATTVFFFSLPPWRWRQQFLQKYMW